MELLHRDRATYHVMECTIIIVRGRRTYQAMSDARAFIEDLVEYANTVAHDHLGIAIDLLFLSRQHSISPTHRRSWVISHRYALSSILHAYCALESGVNLIGHSLFVDSESHRFISPEKRDLPLKRMIKSWDAGLPCTLKLQYLLSLSDISLTPRLEKELNELNNLRNLIVHGVAYKTIILLDKQQDGGFLEADREDAIDWHAKFPLTKFKSLDNLDYQDAHTANRICLNALKLLTSATGEILWISTCLIDRPLKLINSLDVDDYLSDSSMSSPDSASE